MLGILTDGTAENGYYEQAHKIEQMLLVILTSLNIIMRSRMTFLFKSGRLDEMKARLNKSVSFISAVAIPMTAGLVGIAANFIPLFLGEDFEESIVLLQIFSFLLVIIGLSNCLNTHFLGPSGRQGQNNYVLVAGAVLNFLFNLMMIPKLGAVGAAIGSVLAESIILVGYLFLIRDFFKVKTLIQLIWKYVVAGFIMRVAVSYIGKLSGNVVFVLVVQICVGVVLYAGILLLLKDKFAIGMIKDLTGKVRKKMRQQ
ncbi:MAG: polysaccharide biosynthesis C-terminal domain-containing protein [Clostridia bacterium]|nr:polysaccharide biosynthesis C-terminal domain-containing protein [Clostridia bacterium]